MRIIMVNWQDIKHPLGGGAEVHYQEIFQRIVKMGHPVTLLSCRFPGAVKEEVIGGIRVIRTGVRSNFNLIMPFVLRKLLKEKYDILILNINKLPFFTLQYIKLPKLIIAHHFFGKAVFLEASLPLAVTVYCAEELFLKLHRKIDVMYYSNSTKDDLLKHRFPPGKLHFIPIAVDLKTYRVLPGIEKYPTPLIVYLGRIKKYKSVDNLISAMPAVFKSIPDARLIIVGDGDDKRRLEQLTEKLNLRDRIEFMGFISEDEKIEWLNKAWVVVNPSSKEGWGLTMTEANACGTPVVAADSPGLRDAVKDGKTGLLYPYGDIDALSHSIVKILSDSNLRDKLREGGLIYARKYTWDISAEMTLELMQKIIAER